MNNQKQSRYFIWQTLKAQQLVSGEFRDTHDVDSPWFVKLLVAACGWLASAFFLGFTALGLAELFEQPSALIIVGGVLLIAAYFVLRLVEKDRLKQQPGGMLFIEHASLAVSLTGQVMIAIALSDLVDGRLLFWAFLTVFELLLALLMPNFLHRCGSAFAAVLCGHLSLVTPQAITNGFTFLLVPMVTFILSWLWLNEFRLGKYIRPAQALAYGLTLAVMVIKSDILPLTSDLYLSEYSLLYLRLEEGLIGLVLCWLIWRLIATQFWFQPSLFYVENRRLCVRVVAAVLLVILLSMVSYGLSFGVIITLLGFYSANRLLKGLGIIAMLYSLSAYYYWMDATLLVKAGHLFALGVAILLARYFLIRKVTTPTHCSADAAVCVDRGER